MSLWKMDRRSRILRTGRIPGIARQCPYWPVFQGRDGADRISIWPDPSHASNLIRRIWGRGF